MICAVMGFTLTLFFLYHLRLVRNGTTTNESLKKGDYEEALKREIKNLQRKIENKETTEEQRAEAEKFQKNLLEDLETLSNYFRVGLKENLKEVFNQ